jgi:hypothetical protein
VWAGTRTAASLPIGKPFFLLFSFFFFFFFFLFFLSFFVVVVVSYFISPDLEKQRHKKRTTE